ncbi:Hypothetical protein GLP15_3908 [Giardia lamblia P15]|uniref:Uncharacterized protein n=1 Tax=Giardia intestinalis (strain P15) TaxID=658858 RepID=E1F4K6_GIAIA|nr:Hypothetical protein GLP15_3908 [Giardia lamblia P15]
MSSITVNEATLTELLQKTVKLTISNGSSFIGNIIEVHNIFCVLDNVYRETASTALEIIPRPVKFNYDLITEMSLMDRTVDVAHGPPALLNTNGSAHNGGKFSSQRPQGATSESNRPERDGVTGNVEDGEDDLFGDLDLDAERERYKKQLAQRSFITTGAQPDESSAPLSYDSKKSFFDTLTVQKGSRRNNNNGANRFQDTRRNDRNEGSGSFGSNSFNNRRRNDQHKGHDSDGGYRNRNRNRQQNPTQADLDCKHRGTGNRPPGRFTNAT